MSENNNSQERIKNLVENLVDGEATGTSHNFDSLVSARDEEKKRRKKKRESRLIFSAPKSASGCLARGCLLYILLFLAALIFGFVESCVNLYIR